MGLDALIMPVLFDISVGRPRHRPYIIHHLAFPGSGYTRSNKRRKQISAINPNEIILRK